MYFRASGFTCTFLYAVMSESSHYFVHTFCGFIDIVVNVFNSYRTSATALTFWWINRDDFTQGIVVPVVTIAGAVHFISPRCSFVSVISCCSWCRGLQCLFPFVLRREEPLLASSCLFCPSVSIEQLGSHWTNIREISYWGGVSIFFLLLKSVGQIEVR